MQAGVCWEQLCWHRQHQLAGWANLRVAKICQSGSRSRVLQHVPNTIHLSGPTPSAASLTECNVFIIVLNMGAISFCVTRQGRQGGGVLGVFGSLGLVHMSVHLFQACYPHSVWLFFDVLKCMEEMISNKTRVIWLLRFIFCSFPGMRHKFNLVIF